MKKTSSILLLLLLTVFLVPINTEAKTLKELEDEVNKFTSELESKNNQIVNTEKNKWTGRRGSFDWIAWKISPSFSFA